ncbi:MAG TPA: hypothetical protein VLX68_08040 [Chitinivibrionales bacterium]|nr:hypothetical protein [Chitinivibrionales bacterium]
MSKAEIFDRYPVSSVIMYNGTTMVHFLAGGFIFLFLTKVIGSTGIIVAVLYTALSFLEMYIIMPMKVCTNCVYFRLPDSLCISGLNVFARLIAKPGKPANFPNRAKGLLCQNNLYILSLVLPILCGAIFLVFKFNLLLLGLVIGLFVLLALRFFVIIPGMACVHCRSKFICPQAGQMGVREK